MKPKKSLKLTFNGNTPHKSEEGWRRFRERTNHGLAAFRHGLHTLESERVFSSVKVVPRHQELVEEES